MATSEAYLIYWGACFATVITWVFAVVAAADDAWVRYRNAWGTSWSLGGHVGIGCEGTSICELYHGATACQFIATVIVSFALVVVVIAAFTSPPTTSRLGLALGIMLAIFSLFQMIAFSLMADMVAQYNDRVDSANEEEVGPTFAMAVTTWILGLAGAITILVLRSRATTADEGPFRKCMSWGGGVTGGDSAGKHVATV